MCSTDSTKEAMGNAIRSLLTLIRSLLTLIGSLFSSMEAMFATPVGHQYLRLSATSGLDRVSLVQLTTTNYY